jgi:hypothetical protein
VLLGLKVQQALKEIKVLLEVFLGKREILVRPVLQAYKVRPALKAL